MNEKTEKNESCDTCRFFGRHRLCFDLCLRRSPSVFSDGTTCWPEVSPGDWCGEYEQRPEAE